MRATLRRVGLVIALAAATLHLAIDTVHLASELGLKWRASHVETVPGELGGST